MSSEANDNFHLKNDPFLYHKKKYVISSRFSDGDTKEGDDTNNELLVFQDENKKHINTLKNKINKKSFIIEENANNYLNYMMNEKNFNNKNMKKEPGQYSINKIRNTKSFTK